MKKQKEESRKARQAEKRQRRQMRPNEEPIVVTDAATEAPTVGTVSENAKTED